ncbi:MAG: NYN domain-containing protein [Rhodobacteraceae bacterium]|nr:NYN domain-containing protein [Paracoccaceae bacterium]
MATYAYIDNSNIYIEGCRVSAVKKGLAKNIYDAMGSGIVDHTWQLDYGRLYDFLCAEGDVARLWGSPPPGDTFWDMLKRKGFNPTVYDKNFANQEKKVDVAIAHRITKGAYTMMDRTKDEILLVAGDTDYVPVITDLISEGFKVEIAFWDHLARELKEVSTKHIPLNAHHDHLTRK